jgi:uncharacterized zinc-type alcohol dehydrogenase-like protein
MIAARGYAAHQAHSALKPFAFERRELGEKDVHIEILHCGICHSDIHQVNNDWGGSSYPIVPGHEIVGRVVAIGTKVSKFKVGATVGVGCMVDSCQSCGPCHAGVEQMCESGSTWTYNSRDKRHGGVTYGGYSDRIVVDESFVLSVAEHLDLARVAPLLCAGITTYAPLRRWLRGPTSDPALPGRGKRVGVVGLGGLGHMAVKFARAFGADEVVVFTTSASKKDDALALGATEVVLSKAADAMKLQRNRLDVIIDTVSANHDMAPYLAALRPEGVHCLVGLPGEIPALNPFSLVGGQKILTGSSIGNIRETQEMLDFCAKHEVLADIEATTFSALESAYKRVETSDVKYRFVLDAKSL